VLMQHNIFSLFPVTAATGTYLPRSRLKWSHTPPYAAVVRVGLRHLLGKHDYDQICAIYQNDEFGSEVMRGVNELLPYDGNKLSMAVSFQRGETNFTAGVS